MRARITGLRRTSAVGGAGNPFFEDRYDTGAVTNDSGDAVANTLRFTSRGWYDARANNFGDTRSGNIRSIVAADVPGHSGTFPGSTSTPQQAMLFEGLPASLGVDPERQADIQVLYGDSGQSAGFVPADFWMRFWMYIIDSGAMPSTFAARDKFYYPNLEGTGTGQIANDGTATTPILIMYGSRGFEESNPSVPGDFPANQLYWAAQGSGAAMTESGEGSSPINKMYQNLDQTPMTPNTWWEVKHHIKTDSATSAWECWTRPRNAAWVKRAEWLGGTTSGFTFNMPSQLRGGCKQFQMPTILSASPLDSGGVPGSGNGDQRILYRDFCLATTEANLRTGGD